MEFQTLPQELQDEFHRLVQIHLRHHPAHTVQTGALVAENRVFPMLRGLPEGFFQLCALAISYVAHAFGFPYLPAAEVFHPLGEDHGVSGLPEQGAGFVHHAVLHRCAFCEAHGLVDAAREVNHFQFTVAAGFFRRLVQGTRQGLRPERNTRFVQAFAYGGHGLGSQQSMPSIRTCQHPPQSGFHSGKVLPGETAGGISEGAAVHIHLPYQVGEFGCIDLHGAGAGAKPVGRTEDIPFVGIEFAQFPCKAVLVALPLQVQDGTLHRNPHTGRKRKPCGDAVHFTESAFNTFVGAFHSLDGSLRSRATGHGAEIETQARQGLEVLNEAKRIVIEDTAAV